MLQLDRIMRRIADEQSQWALSATGAAVNMATTARSWPRGLMTLQKEQNAAAAAAKHSTGAPRDGAHLQLQHEQQQQQQTGESQRDDLPPPSYSHSFQTSTASAGPAWISNPSSSVGVPVQQPPPQQMYIVAPTAPSQMHSMEKSV